MADKQLVAFRVDSSVRLGGGHLYRCLVIADLLKKHGVQSVFICRLLDGHMVAEIEPRGHSVIGLPASDGADAWQTAEALVRWRAGTVPGWVVTDHMAIGKSWQQEVRKRLGCRMMAIDGLADRHHDVDVLLDPQLTGDLEARWVGLVPSSCKVFSGPWYAPLAPGFVKAREDCTLRAGGVRRLFVCFGGSDSDNLTLRACRAMSRALSGPDRCYVDVAVGPAYRWKAELNVFCRETPGFLVHDGRTDLEHLMGEADLAIGAGGVMAWERCVMGLPTLLATLADNQINAARQLERRGAVITIGWPDDGFEQRLQRALLALLNDPGRLRQMSDAAFRVMSRWPMMDAWMKLLIDGNNDV